MKHWFKFRWPLLLLVLAVTWFYLTDGWDQLALESIQAYRRWLLIRFQQNPALFLMFFFVGQLLLYALSIPGVYIITVLAGSLLGFHLGLWHSVLATSMGVTLASWISRNFLKNFMERNFSRQLEEVNQGINRDGPYYLFSLRLIPPLPYFLVNYGMGLTQMKLKTYFAFSLIGMIPENVLFVSVGTHLASVNQASDILSFRMILFFLLIGLTPLLLKKSIDYYRQRHPLHSQ